MNARPVARPYAIDIRWLFGSDLIARIGHSVPQERFLHLMILLSRTVDPVVAGSNPVRLVPQALATQGLVSF